MKTFIRHIYIFLVPVLMISMLIACEDDEAANGGEPIVYYVRVTNPASSDSLLVSAYLGNLVAIIGDNLGEVRELWFNDRQAVLTPTFITNTSILVNVPNAAPAEVTDKIKMVFKSGKELLYDFKVAIPAPVVQSMDLEYVPDGGTAYINGLYFFDVTPIVVEFPDGAGGYLPAQLVSHSETRLEVIVPDGAGTGPVRVTTNFGTNESVLHFRDQRNIILNYDEAGKTPTGSWRPGIFVSDDNSLDGKYIKFQGVYNAGERIEGEGSPYESQFWAQVSGRSETTMLPGEPADYDLKFETKIVNWYGSYLNICFAPYDFKDSNQELWDNALNARAIWGPWDVKNAPIDTDDKWITVTIPITDFKWAMGMENDNVAYTEMKFNKNVTGSLSFWVLSAPQADNSPFEFYIDNVRIVPNK